MQESRGKHQRNSSLHSRGHTTPTFQFLQSNRSPLKNKEKKNANLYNPIKKERTLISNK